MKVESGERGGGTVKCETSMKLHWTKTSSPAWPGETRNRRLITRGGYNYNQ